MFTASEFRRIARDKLRGHWGRSVLVTFIVSLICGISSIYNLAKNMGHMDFDMLFAGNYNDFLAGFAAADRDKSLWITYSPCVKHSRAAVLRGAGNGP